MEKVKNGKNILITIGWLSAVLAILFFPLFLGVVAICMGVVLRRDYQADKHGLVLIIVGVVCGLGGWILGIILMNQF